LAPEASKALADRAVNVGPGAARAYWFPGSSGNIVTGSALCLTGDDTMATAVDRIPNSSATEPASNRTVPIAAIAWFAALIAIGYLPVLKHLYWQWTNDEDMGHGLFVPIVAAYIAWQRREEIQATPVKPDYRGLILIGWGAIQLVVGTLGAELFLQRTALLFTLVGVILTTCGTRILKKLAFPLFLLVFMIPIPRIVYTEITFPLQLFASRVAEVILSGLGYPVLREGNVLELASQKLSVVEACSGIRSLLSLSFLSLVYAYFFDRKQWMRWTLLAATIPIAIIANAGRVTVTGILSEIRTDLAQGFYHSLEGWLIFAVAMALMIMAHQLINFVYRRVRGTAEPSSVSK
jgi:exosortase